MVRASCPRAPGLRKKRDVMRAGQQTCALTLINSGFAGPKPDCKLTLPSLFLPRGQRVHPPATVIRRTAQTALQQSFDGHGKKSCISASFDSSRTDKTHGENDDAAGLRTVGVFEHYEQ